VQFGAQWLKDDILAEAVRPVRLRAGITAERAWAALTPKTMTPDWDGNGGLHQHEWMAHDDPAIGSSR
jgi:hypothetical protein